MERKLIFNFTGESGHETVGMPPTSLWLRIRRCNSGINVSEPKHQSIVMFADHESYQVTDPVSLHNAIFDTLGFVGDYALAAGYSGYSSAKIMGHFNGSAPKSLPFRYVALFIVSITSMRTKVAVAAADTS